MSSAGDIEWKALGDLREGDYACIVRRGEFGPGADLRAFRFTPKPCTNNLVPFDHPPTLTPEWGRLMGYLVGDGTCTYRKTAHLSCAEPDTQQDQLNLVGKLLGSEKIRRDYRRKPLCTVSGGRTVARAFLAYAGLDYARAKQKRVPWSVMVSPKEVVAEFLRGYFETDGWVSSGGGSVGSASEELISQVHILLLQFGIISRMRGPTYVRLKGKRHGPFWSLSVRGCSREIFAREIGFLSKRKKAHLARYMAGEGTRKTSQCETNLRDIVPHQERKIEAVYRSLQREGRGAWENFFQCFRPSSGTRCTYRQVRKIAADLPAAAHHEHFARLARENYYYDPVTTVEPGEDEVFDLNVPEGAAFVAGGFMNHNTTLGRIHARALLCDAPREGEACNACTSCRSILLGGSSESFFEIDAATNSGKDSIRKIVEEIQYSTFSGKRRLYLIDESHRLSTDALDALLKPLEDTVPGSEDKLLVCIFCTTEPERMRTTILSRCAPAFVVRPVKPEQIAERLADVCRQENIPYDSEALVLIGELTECHIRDALKAVEGVSMLGAVSLDNAARYLHLDVAEEVLELVAETRSNFSNAYARAEKLLQRMSPITLYEKFVELSLLAYRVELSMRAWRAAGSPANRSPFEAVPRYLSSELVARVGAEVGEALLPYAERMAERPGRPTPSMFFCDLAYLNRGGYLSNAAATIALPTKTVSSEASKTQPETQPRVVDNGVYIHPRAVNVQKTAPSPTVSKPSSTELKPSEFFRLVRMRAFELDAGKVPDGGQERRNDVGGPGTDASR
jgi:DNA polymerase III subunit gamma/tau